jgi:hypothetical protein
LRKLATLGLEKVENSDDLFERDFDNLIIIDACRHDLFEEVEGETDYRISRKSCSRGFIEENFSEGDFTDYVVVTGNPFFNEDIFQEVTGRKIYDVFHEVFKTFETKWDKETRTIKPSSIKDDLETAEKLFPNKKKIVWFMQPHYPFLSLEIESETNGVGRRIGESETDIWKELEKGNFSDEQVWEAYRGNLEYVLPFIEECSGILNGKTLLTSDHGNLVGENGLYGHPCNFNLEAVKKVPLKEI